MTPLERAARALCTSMGTDPDQTMVTAGGFQTSVRRDIRRPGEGPYQWQAYVPAARAVLEAIQEPSEAMMDAGSSSEFAQRPYPGGEVGEVMGHDIASAWRAMIDAALEEGL